MATHSRYAIAAIMMADDVSRCRTVRVWLERTEKTYREAIRGDVWVLERRQLRRDPAGKRECLVLSLHPEAVVHKDRGKDNHKEVAS
jgi:hypothetical protein